MKKCKTIYDYGAGYRYNGKLYVFRKKLLEENPELRDIKIKYVRVD